MPPLRVTEGGLAVTLSGRVRVDTEAACGRGRRTDPDDCIALLLLARSEKVEIAEVSTVFGNASLAETTAVTRGLAGELAAAGPDRLAVYEGPADALDDVTAPAPPAHAALARALEQGALTLLALRPLTNIAATLDGRPDLQQRVVRLVAIMGRRPGHIFHPAEGEGGGILFGHGPVFCDFNLDMDHAAARRVLSMDMPTTLVPYEAARDATLTPADLARMSAEGEPASWAAERSREWMAFWRSAIWRAGFYFDLVAAQYVLTRELFDCARTTARVGPNPWLWHFRFQDPDALLVEPPDTGEGRDAWRREVV